MMNRDALHQAQLWQESRGRPDALSPAGAMGLMQIMPATARNPGFGLQPLNDPWNPQANEQFGRAYMDKMLARYGGDQMRALVAYNWGAENADKWDGKPESLPAETRNYVNQILGDAGRSVQVASAGEFDPVAAGAVPVEDEFDPVKAGAVLLDDAGINDRVAQAHAAAAMPSQPKEDRGGFMDAAEGMARAVGSGIRSGVEGLAGMGGDVRQLASDLTGLPFPPIGPLAGPTSADIRAMTNQVVGEGYKPETTAQEYAYRIGEFAPSAVAGPGGAIRKAAMAVVPAVMSEGLGQATEGTAAEPYARVAGAVAGGGVAASKANVGKAVTKEAAKNAPSAEALKATTDQLYNGLRNAGIQYDANDYARMVQGMADTLRKKGFRPVGADKVAFDWVDELANGIGKAQDFDDINSIIQSIGQQARGASAMPDKKSLGAALNIIRDQLMDFEQNAAFVSKVGLSRDTMNQVRSAARDTAKRNIKNRVLTELLENAENYTSGQEAGIRNQINSLLRSKRGKQLFTGAERKALQEVASGRKTIQQLGKFGFDIFSLSGNAAFTPALGALGTGAAFGAPVGAAVAGAGTAAKYLSPYLTNKRFQETVAGIRAGKLTDKTLMNAQRAERIKSNVRKALLAAPTYNQLSVSP